MVGVTCLICHKAFSVKPSHLKLGWGKYCSMSCRNISQRKGSFVTCATCGDKIYRSPAKLHHAKSQKHFCSKKCQTLWRNSYFIREKHQNWNGGTTIYRHILDESQLPKVCVLCHIDDPRVLVAHHIDHDRKNNGSNNLIWLCLNCHYLAHHNQELDTKIRKMRNNIPYTGNSSEMLGKTRSR